MSRDPTRAWTPAFIAAAPVAAVMAIRAVWPAAGPSPAVAREHAPVGLDDRLPPLDPLSAEAIGAREAGRAAIAGATLESPFLVEVDAAGATPAEPARAAEAPVNAETARVDPAFVLSSIVAGQRGGATIAIINGKVRRAGEAIAPGWMLESIDAAAGTATVREASGRTLALTRPGPGAAR